MISRLCEEHELIRSVLDRFEAVLPPANPHGEIPAGGVQPFLDFFDGFVLGVHAGKEDHALFPLLRRSGMVAEGSPLDALAQEHEAIRTLVRALAAEAERPRSNAGAVGAEFVASGLRLVEYVRRHLAREEHCIFGWAARLLHGADPLELERIGEAAEQRAADPATLQRRHALAHELARGGGPPPADP